MTYAVELDPQGREYIAWTITGLDGDETIAVSLDEASWTDMEWTSSTEVRVLCAGPDATANPVGALVLAEGNNSLSVRVSDNPEVIIRDAGIIVVR